MAIALDAIGNFAMIGATVGLALNQPKAPLTTVIVGPGNADDNDNLGGNAPHVAIWDNNGHRVDQWTPHPNPKKGTDIIKEGQIFEMDLSNNQIGGDQADPQYVLLSMLDNNALCVAAVSVTGNGDTWNWYGDIGKKCGAQWYHNDKVYGSNNFRPACTWISGPTHPHGYKYNGISMHIADFNSDEGLVQEYNDHPDAVCKSGRRFKMWEDIQPDGVIDFFKPALTYKPDGSDVDWTKVVDPKPKSKRGDAKERLDRRGNNNNNPSTLVISPHDAHSAKEVCESHTAVGPDIVSMSEKLFCDMSTGQTWPLCDASLKTGCFDMDSKTLKAGKQARDVDGNALPEKSYKNVNQWGKTG